MLSKIIVGTMKWGKWGKNYPAKEMANLIEKAVELGLTSFDHAAIYGGYTNEEDFGNAFKLVGIPREDVQFITKCGIQYPCPTNDYKVKHYNYSASEISKSVETSLRNLRTDFLDVFLLHRPSPLMNIYEVAETIMPLIVSGKIKSFGVSNFSAQKIDLLKKVLPVDYNQVELSVTKPDFLFDGLIDHHEKEGIRPMAWKPLGTVYESKPEQSKEVTEIIGQLTEKYSCNLDALLLAWIMKHSSSIIPVIGTTLPDRIESQSKAIGINIGIEDWFLLLKTIRGFDVP